MLIADPFGRMATVLRNAPEARQSHKSPTLQPFYISGLLLKLVQILAVKVLKSLARRMSDMGFSQKNGTLCALLDWWATSFAVVLSSAQIEAALLFLQETFSEADLCRM